MSQKDLEQTIPYGDLGIIPLESSKLLGSKVDEYIVGWRTKAAVDSSNHYFTNYKKDMLINSSVLTCVVLMILCSAQGIRSVSIFPATYFNHSSVCDYIF